jgi:2,4-diaminopentanoate dehydrogenase
MGLRPIRAIVYGLGSVGRMTTRYLREKQVDVVAAYVRTVEGKDFSAPELSDVDICQPHVPFETFGADIVLMTHCTHLADLYEPAVKAARAGLDVVTIAEDAFEPFYSDADTPTARELDAIFRSHGKTLVSVGVQDTFWYAQPLAFLASVQRIDRLIGRNICDLGAFGTVGGHGDQIGITADEFYANGYDKASGHRGIFDVALRPLIRALGLAIRSNSTVNAPVIAVADMPHAKTQRPILAGTTCGFIEKVVFKLENDVTIEGHFILQHLPPGETAYNEWIVEGTPSMNMRTDSFLGDIITPASLVNRVRDTLDAPPGFLGVDQLGPARFMPVLMRRQ